MFSASKLVSTSEAGQLNSPAIVLLGTIMTRSSIISCGRTYTEVQRVSLVGYTGGEDGSPGLCNLQNLHAVPPYGYWSIAVLKNLSGIQF